MFTFTPASNPFKWSGSCWSVENDDLLAEMVARVALGQAHHVQEILQNTGCESIAPQFSALQGARKLLTVKNPSSPYHRDGWLFQTISWIASHITHPELLKSPPQMIHAHKGFDSLQIGLSESGQEADFVLIGEDKATENPRSMLTDKVWPELGTFDRGERDNELISETMTILALNTSIDARLTVSKIFWEKVRRYRVAVATDEDHIAPTSRAKLFKGLEAFPKNGTESDRLAELLCRDDLRSWFSEVAVKAITHAEKLTDSANV